MILIPENEDRIFKYGILPNNLKYTIICDKNADMSNVVMSVGTGTLYEPVEFMGLAHFLEHMLFMGSSKYQEEDYYFKKLKEFGGSSNAYTENYTTVYYFNILNDNLDIMIDIFSRFFIDPLFNINSVSREINAVNSEHLKNLNDDGWIMRQIIFNITKKDHIINRFGTGNHKTLGSNIKKLRDAMIDFYNKYYCANNMCLTIQSCKPIKEVEKIIKNCFGPIKQKLVKNVITPINKFNSYNNEYHLQTVQDYNTINYIWEVPNFLDFKDNKVINAIIYAINLNCKNNIENILVEMKLITSLNTTYIPVGLILLTIEILPEHKNLKNVIIKINDMVRCYFNNLKITGGNNWNKIYDNYIKITDLNYKNSNKEENIDLATNISSNMHYFDEKYLYNGHKIVIKKEYSKLLECLNYLTFNKANIIYGSKHKLFFKSNYKKDKYYEKYYCKLENRLEKSLISNNKINCDFNININDINIKPTIIKNLDKYNIPKKLAPCFWYGGVSKFNEPLVIGVVLINSKRFFNTVQSLIISIISIRVINYYLSLLYCNELAVGYNASFNCNYVLGLIGIKIYGYNDKYVDFFNKVMMNLANIEPSNSIIENTISVYIKDLENMDKDSPWNMSINVLSNMINKYIYDYKDELKNMKFITVDMIKKRINKIISLKELPITTIIYGNIKYQDLKTCYTYNMNLHCKHTKTPKQYMPKNLIIKHPNKDEKNCCISFIFPINIGYKYNPLLSAKLLILNNILENPAFDELRTKAQLGYLVKSKLTIDYISYIKLSVQSALDYKKVEETMNNFINITFKNILETMDKNTFDLIKQSIYDTVMEKENNLYDISLPYINEILIQEYIFDRKKIVAKKIKDISLNDIKNLYHSIIKEKIVIKII